MNALKVALSPFGRLSPRAFAPAAILLYAVGALSYLLLTGSITAVAGALAFLLAQAIMTWIWFVLHAKRLRDADRPTGIALAVAALYGLGVILILLLIALIVASSPERAAPAHIDLLAVLWIVGVIATGANITATNYVILGLLALGCAPVALALALSLWAGTRKRMPATP
jgi:uncharacterized membrane protein YhaH (DUF805 family)